MQSKQQNAAIQDYTKAIEIKSDYAIAFNNRGSAKFELDDFQKLYELFSELYGSKEIFYFDEIQNS